MTDVALSDSYTIEDTVGMCRLDVLGFSSFKGKPRDLAQACTPKEWGYRPQVTPAGYCQELRMARSWPSGDFYTLVPGTCEDDTSQSKQDFAAVINAVCGPWNTEIVLDYLNGPPLSLDPFTVREEAGSISLIGAAEEGEEGVQQREASVRACWFSDG